MSDVGHIAAAYQEAVRNPSRGRKKNGTTARSKTGLTGAYRCLPRGKWRSSIRINKETIVLKNSEGKTYFHSAEEAHAAYIAAATKAGLIKST